MCPPSSSPYSLAVSSLWELPSYPLSHHSLTQSGAAILVPKVNRKLASKMVYLTCSGKKLEHLTISSPKRFSWQKIFLFRQQSNFFLQKGLFDDSSILVWLMDWCQMGANVLHKQGPFWNMPSLCYNDLAADHVGYVIRKRIYNFRKSLKPSMNTDAKLTHYTLNCFEVM